MKRILRARAPAKLILTGEHSVVFGRPAIAMAVNKYTETEINWHRTSAFIFRLLNLETVTSNTIHALKVLRQRLSDDYYDFLNGNCSIKDVIKKPFELLQFSVTNLIEKLNINLPSGLEIKVNSSIPMGCGMGSSAALVISTLYALVRLLGLEVDTNKFINIGKDAENLQHGRSSGLDLHLSAFGGIRKFCEDSAVNIPAMEFPFYIVNTGKPAATTGECVSVVKDKLQDESLVTEFGNTTLAIEQAMLDNKLDNFKLGIKANHTLLTRIGVVPEKVANFIADIEKANGASKICGAGSVVGDNAGVVLLVGEKEQLAKTSQKYGYTLEKVAIDNKGAHIV